MAIIEKKYLLHAHVKTLLKNETFKKTQQRKFYTQVEACKEIYFSQSNNHYEQTTHAGNKPKKNLITKKITQKAYKKAKDKRVGKKIQKTHFLIQKKHPTIYMSHYKKSLKGLYILDIIFQNSAHEADFTMPSALIPFLKKEITHDKRYQEKNLALLGNPYKHPYSIYTIFKDIEQNRLTDAKKRLFPQMLVSDATRIVLYKHYIDLKNDANILITENDIHALTRFRNNLKETLIILEECAHIFDKKLYKKVLHHLQTLDKTIYQSKDYASITTHLSLVEDILDSKATNSFISQLDNRLEKEKHKVQNFFKTREFKIILDQFSLLLKEPNNIHHDYYDSTTIKHVMQERLYKRFKKFDTLCQKFDKCHDLEAYTKLEKSLFKTRVLFENFASLHEKKKSLLLQKSIQNAHDKLQDFITLNHNASIIKSQIKHSKKPLQEQRKLIDRISKKRKYLEKKSIMRIEERIASLRAQRHLFKK